MAGGEVRLNHYARFGLVVLFAVSLSVAWVNRSSLHDDLHTARVTGRLIASVLGWHDSQEDQKEVSDWEQIREYAHDNQQLPKYSSGRVVFIGDSIIEHWGAETITGRPFFPGSHYIDRGIGGQTSEQILARFRNDVVALRPETVVIYAGTNDLRSYPKPIQEQITKDSITMMVDIARSENIRVILCSILPATRYDDYPNIKPSDRIIPFNSWLSEYASRAGAQYVDFYSAMADKSGKMQPAFTSDGIHPNADGYRVMDPLVQSAISKATELARK
jgi:acyl-CoA thioesterase-1